MRQQRRMGESREEPLPQKMQPRLIEEEEAEEEEEEIVYETYHYNEHRHDREDDPHVEQMRYPSSFQPRPRQHGHHSDQFGYEHPYHPGQQQHDGRRRQQKYYPPYSSSHSGAQRPNRYSRVSNSYQHRQRAPTTRNGRSTIPTMNGQNIGSGGINGMRNRMY